MRVPTTSDGTRSGVNWMRLNEPLSTSASVLMVSVLARPGTPSSSRWPPARSAMKTRSSMASWPTTTRLISNRACSSVWRAAAFVDGVSVRGSSASVDGDGEVDADAAAARANAHRIDADDFAGGVEQRAPGVAGIGRGVGLDQAGDGGGAPAAAQRAVDGADDAGGDGVLKAEGAAHGDDRLAGADGVRVAELDELALVGGDGGAQDGQVVGGVGADDLRLDSGAV